MGTFKRKIPEPCQPLLNASLVLESGTLAPPPNPIWMGPADARWAASRKGSKSRARVRMMVILQIGVAAWNDRHLRWTTKGSQATADAEARPEPGADGCRPGIRQNRQGRARGTGARGAARGPVRPAPARRIATGARRS